MIRKMAAGAGRTSPPSGALMPEDFLKELGRNEKAKALFETLNKRNTMPSPTGFRTRRNGRPGSGA